MRITFEAFKPRHDPVQCKRCQQYRQGTQKRIVPCRKSVSNVEKTTKLGSVQSRETRNPGTHSVKRSTQSATVAIQSLRN